MKTSEQNKSSSIPLDLNRPFDPDKVQGLDSEEDKKRCEEMRDQILGKSEKIKVLMGALSGMGCNLKLDHFKCQPCNDTASGAFDEDVGIIICQNQLSSPAFTENTVVHELIHIHDWFKFKIDRSNCYHSACMEVRAASLSNDCSFNYEFRRGFFGIKKHHQECVRRRAILSISQIPYCSEPGYAEKVVDKVFQDCYNDRQPFKQE